MSLWCGGGGGAALLVRLLFAGARHVERGVDDLGDGLDLGAQLLLDAVQREAVLVRDEVDGDAEVAEAARAPDAVQVGLGHAREVEVDDHVDGLHVDAAREQVGAHEVAAQAGAEVVEHAVAVRLRHARVDVVAAVAQLRDLLGQQLHALGRVAEYNGLVDLQLEQQTTKTVNINVHKFTILMKFV